MTILNIPFDHAQMQLNASKLVTLLYANQHMAICIFTPNIDPQESDPLEYGCIHHAVEEIVSHWPCHQFSVGLNSMDEANPYFCITVLPKP